MKSLFKRSSSNSDQSSDQKFWIGSCSQLWSKVLNWFLFSTLIKVLIKSFELVLVLNSDQKSDQNLELNCCRTLAQMTWISSAQSSEEVLLKVLIKVLKKFWPKFWSKFQKSFAQSSAQSSNQSSAQSFAQMTWIEFLKSFRKVSEKFQKSSKINFSKII